MYHSCEEGQGLVEYALILVLVVLVIVGTLTAISGQIINLYTYIMSVMPF